MLMAHDAPEGAPRWATVKEVATHLGVSERTVRAMIADGRITAQRLGARVIRIDLNDIDRPIELQSNVSPAELQRAFARVDLGVTRLENHMAWVKEFLETGLTRMLSTMTHIGEVTDATREVLDHQQDVMHHMMDFLETAASRRDEMQRQISAEVAHLVDMATMVTTTETWLLTHEEARSRLGGIDEAEIGRASCRA